VAVKTDATTLFNPKNDQNGADFFNTHACYRHSKIKSPESSQETIEE
jgi:hypothetical protein